MPPPTTSGIRNVINPQCYRNFAQSCVLYIPFDWLQRYFIYNIDTIPKLLDHILVLMAVCNFFCIISARKIAHLSAFVRHGREEEMNTTPASAYLIKRFFSLLPMAYILP